ncbi:hypothetical protein HUU61_22280 [Rhodopseudomonas palustris]|nr:hypothetical protein [Rhodopseudomonas palustris]
MCQSTLMLWAQELSSLCFGLSVKASPHLQDVGLIQHRSMTGLGYQESLRVAHILDGGLGLASGPMAPLAGE